MSDDSFGLTLDPVLAELGDEFSRRTLAGETVDVDQLVSAHPEQAEAFRKILPILQGLAELEPVDGGDDRDGRRRQTRARRGQGLRRLSHRPRDRPRRHGGRLRGPPGRPRAGGSP